MPLSTTQTVPSQPTQSKHTLPDPNEAAELMRVRRLLCSMIGPPPETLDYDEPDDSYLLPRQHLCRLYNRLFGKMSKDEFWAADDSFWHDMDEA